MNPLKKKGHNIRINNIVIHRINKSAGSRNVSINLALSPIKIGDNEVRFIADLHAAYYKKSNPVYGVFANEYPDFKSALCSYMSAKKDFLSFTSEGANIYKKHIKLSTPATGGFLIFADYVNTDSNIRHLLVLTTNNNDGFTINDDLQIKDVKTIDMSKVDVACLINITKFSSVNPAVTDADTYLSFVKGNKDISIYFMSFIDCNDKTTSKLSSRRLLTAIDDYMNIKGLDIEEKRKRKNEIFGYCDSCISGKHGIQLSMISGLINPENPTEFSEYASSEEIGVSAVISGNRTELRTLKSVYYKDKSMTISFERGLLNTKKLKYHAGRKELIFRDLPQELIDQITNK